MILRLLGIEAYKSLSRVGNLIIIFVIIVAAFFSVPVIKANEYGYISKEPEKEIPRAAEEMYRENLQLAEKSDGLRRDYYLVCAEAYKTLLDNNVAAGCWQFDRYFDYYFRAMGSLWALEAAKDPSHIEEIKSIVYNEKYENENIFYYNILHDVKFDDENNVSLCTADILDRYPYVGYGEDLTALCGDAESLAPLIAYERNFSEELKANLILTTKEYAEKKTLKYTELKAEEEKASEEYQKDMEKRTRDYYLSIKSAAGCERVIEGYELLKDCSAEREAWVLEHAEFIEREYREDLPDYIIMSPGEFEANDRFDRYSDWDHGRRRRFDSFDEYLSFAKERENRILLAMDCEIYSARYKSESDYTLSSKIHPYYALDCFQAATKTDVLIVMFLCILFAGSIMSNEYGSGTARLLLIRPCSRWKILTGKLLCVILFGVAALGLTFISSYFGTLCTFGADSLNPVMIFKTGGEIREVNRTFFCIAEGYIYSLPAFATVILGLLLSLISKKALISAAGSALPFFFGIALAKSSWKHLARYPILKYTPIPYFMTLDELADPYNASSINDVTPWEYGLYFNTAVTVLLLYIAALTAVCYIVFCRQQVKQ